MRKLNRKIVKYLMILIPIYVFISCNYQEKSTEKSNLDNASKIDTINDKLSMQKVNLVDCNDSIDKDALLKHIDSTISVLSKSKYLSNYTIYTNTNIDNISSCETYYSVKKNTFTDFPRHELYKEIDTINILDSIIVPLFNGKPYGIRLPCELCYNLNILCIFKNKIGFARIGEVINQTEISEIHDGKYKVYRGNNIIVQRQHDKQFKSIPTYNNLNSNFSWAMNYSDLTYSVSVDIGAPTYSRFDEIYLFNLPKWENTKIDTGAIPHFVDSNNIFYFKKRQIKDFRYFSINHYNTETKEIDEIYVIPDSLDLTGYGPDLFEYSVVKRDIYRQQDCYSIVLYRGEGEDPNSSRYKLYFSLSGEELNMEKL